MLSSEDAGHRDWRNVRKNNLQNMAKEPEKPTTTIRPVKAFANTANNMLLVVLSIPITPYYFCFSGENIHT